MRTTYDNTIAEFGRIFRSFGRRVHSFGPTGRASSLSRHSGGAKSEPFAKRKRNSKKLDGFVIISDEEEADMDEISKPKDDQSTNGSQRLLKKTVRSEEPVSTAIIVEFSSQSFSVQAVLME